MSKKKGRNRGGKKNACFGGPARFSAPGILQYFFVITVPIQYLNGHPSKCSPVTVAQVGAVGAVSHLVYGAAILSNTFMSDAGCWPPSVSVPQPATVTLLLTYVLSPLARQMGWMVLLYCTSSSRVRIATSFH